MKIFLDTANIAQIERWVKLGIIDGVTTNPTLLSKEIGSPRQIFTKICSLLPEGDISIEVTEQEPEMVYTQAKELAAFAPNVIVKIPFSEPLLPIINRLSLEGICINVTLIFSMLQALIVAKMGVTYISPFIGRIDDIDGNGIELIKQLIVMKQNYGFESEILAASIRTLSHLNQVCLLGVDVATIPSNLLELLMHHPLTEKGMAQFDADWKKLGIPSMF